MALSTELNRFLRYGVPFQPATDSHEGRLMPHPEEAVERPGLQFEVVTVRSRRNLLEALAAGVATRTRRLDR